MKVVKILAGLCVVIILCVFMYNIHLLGTKKRTAILDARLEQNANVIEFVLK
jgi:hypothetical protein